MDDEAAIAGLERLGLTSYEARVFLALQKLGTATASEVSDVAAVPRSQVYGAADRLEERGLVETRQSTPTAYRPVSLERARTRLLDRLQQTGTETFDYLETVGGNHEAEQTESIWLVRGRDAVTSRIAEQIEDATDLVLYATDDPDLLDGTVLAALRAVSADRTVVVGSSNPDVRSMVAEDSDIEQHTVPDKRSPEDGIGRALIADDRTLLLSVYSSTGVPEGTEEVAFWSADSTFAAVLVEFLVNWLANPIDRPSDRADRESNR